MHKLRDLVPKGRIICHISCLGIYTVVNRPQFFANTTELPVLALLNFFGFLELVLEDLPLEFKLLMEGFEPILEVFLDNIGQFGLG